MPRGLGPGTKRVIKQIHIYAGLLCFCQLLVYGIAGLAATFASGPPGPPAVRSVRTVPFRPAPDATDKEVAAQAYRSLKLPLARPIPDWFLQHDRDNNLQLDYYTVNGLYRVVVLEKRNELRVEEMRAGGWDFLGNVHAATPDGGATALPVRLWAVYNEFAMWALIGFCFTGLYLWLASRPRFGWAQLCLFAGAVSFALLYFSLK